MAKDKFHDNVRTALQKEGWTITAEQMRIDLGVTFVEAVFDAYNDTIQLWKK